MKAHKNDNELHLGIDLGTTNSLGAVFDGSGIVKVLPNMDGDMITQSIISVASKPPVVGRIAKQDKFFHPEMVAELFKRYMDMDQPVALVTSQDGQEYTPVLLSAELLHYLKVSAEKLEGRTFSKVVIGTPAYFGKRARQATKDAGLVAGFEEVHIVDEPTLAATFYGLAKGQKAKIAVFDFGGGTFDISILNISEDGRTEPVAIDGDSECGGSNIDEVTFQQYRDFVQQKGSELSQDKDYAEWLEALEKCKEAKEALARKDTALVPARINGERTSMELTYEQLKELSAPVMKTLRDRCQKALDKAGLAPSDIDKVVLVGGSTRLRFVAEIVKDVFGQDPVTDTDPDLAVAKGAAIVAAAHFGKPDRELIVDGKRYLAAAVRPQITIAPKDLCVAVVEKNKEGDEEEYNVPIIPAGSKLPYEATQHFTPIVAGTSAVRVKLYDNHAGKRSKDCTPLLQAEIETQPTDETNNADRIEFKISMDVEGLVDLNVRDKLLNKPVPIKFKFDTGLSDSEIEKARSQLLARHENGQAQIDKG
jgi:molecular chaperone DnaK